MALTMPMRQPFSDLDLDSPRPRSLARSKLNIQNQQNGLAAITKNRQLPAPDSGNSDPTGLKPSIKRKRASDDEDEPTKQTTSPAKKTNRTVLTPTTGPALSPRPIYSPLNPLPAVSTPKSAPAPARKPAGRSPPPPLQTKSSKPFARRSTITKSRGEAANSSKKRVRRPFSLATVLGDDGKATAAAAAAKSKSQPQIQPQPQTQRKPASWFFDIHVDTKDDEMTNLMQHSTCVLDISDDEDGKPDCEGRGKENIPPTELGVGSIPVSSSRGGEVREPAGKVDERAPLGELNAAEYYGAGCDAFSCAVVHEGDEVGGHSKGKGKKNDEERCHIPCRTGSGLQDSSSIAALLDATAPVKPADEKPGPGPAEAEFVIWESGSAAGDV
ncbi:hypothetical protein PHISP_01882 [Aspergillus sp. HF37]|nr:hypothetical protein PHISP_01882 [Aspergillus sp. HF37]